MDRGWWVLAAAAATATGLVAALGGFAPTAGARVQPGVAVELLRWDLTVQRAEVVEDEVRIWFTVVNTSDETQTQPWGLVSLLLPDGPVKADDWTIPGRSTAFDPDLPQAAYVTAPAQAAGATIGVQLSDERRSDTPAPIEVWSITGPVAQVEVAAR